MDHGELNLALTSSRSEEEQNRGLFPSPFKFEDENCITSLFINYNILQTFSKAHSDIIVVINRPS